MFSVPPRTIVEAGALVGLAGTFVADGKVGAEVAAGCCAAGEQLSKANAMRIKIGSERKVFTISPPIENDML